MRRPCDAWESDGDELGGWSMEIGSHTATGNETAAGSALTCFEAKFAAEDIIDAILVGLRRRLGRAS